MKCLCFFSFPFNHTQLQPCRAQSRMMIVDGRSCEPATTARQWNRKRNEENSESEIWWSWLNSQWKETCDNLRRVRFRWGLPNGFAIADGQSLHLWVKANSELLRFWDSFFDTKKRNLKNRNQKSHFLGKSVKKFRSKIDDGLFVLETGEVWPHIQFLSIEKGRQNGLRKSFIPTDLNIEEHRNFESANPSRIKEIKAERNMSKIKKISKKSRCQNAIWDDLSHPLVSHRHCESPLHPSHKIQDCFSIWCCSFGHLYISELTFSDAPVEQRKSPAPKPRSGNFTGSEIFSSKMEKIEDCGIWLESLNWPPKKIKKTCSKSQSQNRRTERLKATSELPQGLDGGLPRAATSSMRLWESFQAEDFHAFWFLIFISPTKTWKNEFISETSWHLLHAAE